MRQKIKQSTEKQSLTIPERPQPTTSDSDGKDKVDATLATNILLLRYGTPEEKKSAMSSLEDHESMKGKKFVIGADNRISVVNVNDRSESTNPVSLDASIVSDKDFVSAFNTLFKLGDIDKAYVKAQQGGRFKGKQPVLSGKLESEKKDVKSTEKFSNVVTSKITSLSKDETEAKSQLDAILTDFGYEVNEAVIGRDYIEIVSPELKDINGKSIGGSQKKKTFNLEDGNVVQQINAWISKNTPSDFELNRISNDLNREYDALMERRSPAGKKGELDQ
jgi:hypothetical protein